MVLIVDVVLHAAVDSGGGESDPSEGEPAPLRAWDLAAMRLDGARGGGLVLMVVLSELQPIRR